MFGSDFPMWDPKEEYRQFTALPFTDDELENMLHHNAERFLGFKVEYSYEDFMNQRTFE